MSKQKARELPTGAILVLTALFTLGLREARAQNTPIAPAPQAEAANSSETHAKAASSGTSTGQPLRLAFDSGRENSFGGGAIGWTAETAAQAPSGGQGTQGGAQQPQGGNQPPPQPYTPLTGEQKMRRAFRRAFISPEGHLRSAISATITQLREEDQPHKDGGDKFADGLTRFAIRSGTRMTRTMLGSGVYAVLFRQDPRYERAEKKGVGQRVLHAASRVWVTRGDDGRLKPNYSRWAGNLSASALSNLWERSTPGHDRIGVDATFRRFGNYFITDTWQTIVFGEFFPDLIRVIRKK